MTKDNKEEFLDSIGKIYDITNKDQEFDYYYRQYHFEEISSNLIGNEILELGCSTGLSTKLLSDLGLNITVVEGSQFNIQQTKKNFDLSEKVEFHLSLWNNFSTSHKFSDILLVDSLQFIEKKERLLNKYKKILAKNGLFHIVIPNSNSLHRHIGLEMGIINSLTDQSDRDIAVASSQDLDWELSRKLFKKVGLEVLKETPILLKPFDNKTMLSFSEQQIKAYFKVASKFKDICSHMYFVLRNV